MTPNIYSNSALDALADCEEKGVDAMSLDRHGKAGPSRQGQFVHYVHHRYIQHLVDKKRDSDVEVGERIIAKAIGALSAEDAAGTIESARRWMENYSADWLLDFQWVLLEERLHVHVDEPGTAVDPAHIERDEPLFAMTPDLVGLDDDGCLHVLDAKNGWNPKHINDPRQNRQLLRYAAPFVARFDPKKVFLHVEHTRHCNRETDVVEPGYVYGQWQEIVLDPIRRWEHRLKEAARRTNYTVGAHCTECDLRGACPAYARFPGEVDDLTGAELVDAEAVLNTKLKAVRARLRDELDASDGGSITTARHVAAFSTSDRGTYDYDKTRAILEEYLPESMVPKAFSATKTSIEKLLKEASMKPAERKKLHARLLDEAATVKKINKLAVKKVEREESTDEG